MSYLEGRGSVPKSDKARAWLAAYQAGQTATEAVHTAGYKCTTAASAKSIGSRLLKQYADLLRADGRRAAEDDARQASIDEIRRYWAAVMRDPETETRDRLRASELAAKSMGAFVERREVVAAQTITVKLTDDE